MGRHKREELTKSTWASSANTDDIVKNLSLGEDPYSTDNVVHKFLQLTSDVDPNLIPRAFEAIKNSALHHEMTSVDIAQQSLSEFAEYIVAFSNWLYHLNRTKLAERCPADYQDKLQELLKPVVTKKEEIINILSTMPKEKLVALHQSFPDRCKFVGESEVQRLIASYLSFQDVKKCVKPSCDAGGAKGAEGIQSGVDTADSKPAAVEAEYVACSTDSSATLQKLGGAAVTDCPDYTA